MMIKVGINSMQRAALALGAVGLLTFFLPIVHLTPAALGRADWSAYQVTTEAFPGEPRVMQLFDSFAYWSPYAALVVTLVLVWTPQWHKLVFAWSALNLWCIGKWDFDRSTFFSIRTHWTADGSFERLPTFYGLAILLAAMLFVCWTDYRTKTSLHS